MKFDPVITTTILALCAIIVNAYTLGMYLLGASDRWLSDAGLVLSVVAFAMFLGIEDDV
jgi:hypothetical protein